MIKEATCFTKNAGLSPIFAKYSVIFGVKFLYRCQFCQLLNEIFLHNGIQLYAMGKIIISHFGHIHRGLRHRY